MDRRRFEAAHLKYACLQMINRYPNTPSSALGGIRFEIDVMDTLTEMTPVLFQSFESRYAGLYSYYVIRNWLNLVLSHNKPKSRQFGVHS